MGQTEVDSDRPVIATLSLDESPVPETPQPAATPSDQQESVTLFHQRESTTPFDQLGPTSTPTFLTPPPTQLPQPHHARPWITVRSPANSSPLLAQRVTPDLSPSPESHFQPHLTSLPAQQLTRKRRLSLSNSPDPINPRDDDDQPSHHTWVLDERHPEFLSEGQDFLLSIPGGEDWQELLSRYVEFEGLAPFVSFSAPTPCYCY